MEQLAGRASAIRNKIYETVENRGDDDGKEQRCVIRTKGMAGPGHAWDIWLHREQCRVSAASVRDPTRPPLPSTWDIILLACLIRHIPYAGIGSHAALPASLVPARLLFFLFVPART